MNRPGRLEMARDHRARQDANRKQRLDEARRTAEFRTGNPQAVFGRISLPGELPGMAPEGSQEAIFGTEESQWLTKGKTPV